MLSLESVNVTITFILYRSDSNRKFTDIKKVSTSFHCNKICHVDLHINHKLNCHVFRVGQSHSPNLLDYASGPFNCSFCHESVVSTMSS